MHLLSYRHQINVFFSNCYCISFQDMIFFMGRGEFIVLVINHYHMNGLHLFWDSFEWFCHQISSEAKYFPLLSMALWLRINSCYSILFLHLKQKKNTTLLLAGLFADQPICLVGRVFANGPGEQVSIPGRVIPKTRKIGLDTSLG